MLGVAVRGHNALASRAILNEPIEGGFERRALAEVYVVGEKRHGGMLRRIGEVFQTVLAAPVVDNDYIVKAGIFKSLDDSG